MRAARSLGLEGIVASREATIKRLLGMIDSHKKLDQMKDGIIAAQREQVAGLVSIARKPVSSRRDQRFEDVGTVHQTGKGADTTWNAQRLMTPRAAAT